MEMSNEIGNAEGDAARGDTNGLAAPKLIKNEKRDLPAGTEREIAMEFKDPSGAVRTWKSLSWLLDAADSYMSFHYFDMGPAMRFLALHSVRKGPVLGDSRKDLIEMLVISELGEIRRLPARETEVLVSAMQAPSPEEAIKQFHIFFKRAFADIRSRVGRPFPSEEHLDEDIEVMRKYMRENFPKKNG
jgi:hypothetical protein